MHVSILANLSRQNIYLYALLLLLWSKGCVSLQEYIVYGIGEDTTSTLMNLKVWILRSKLNYTCCGYGPGEITGFGQEPPSISKKKKKKNFSVNCIVSSLI